MGIADPFSRGRYVAERAYAGLLREVGLVDGVSVFDHPAVRVWRDIPERQNAVLDATLADGRRVRLHVKRNKPAGRGGSDPADDEVRGLRLLNDAGIATAPLAAHGVVDGRSFVITEDLYGHAPADRLIDDGTFAFGQLAGPLAATAAALHDARLHHRDLYLCHFFVSEADPADVKLIDAARVRPLPKILFPRRWVVKDLAQFWYSARAPRATDADRAEWLARYAEAREIAGVASLRREVERKASRIADHDRAVQRDRPERAATLPPLVPA